MPRGDTERYFRDIFGGFSLVEVKLLLILANRKGTIRTEGDLRRPPRTRGPHPVFERRRSRHRGGG